jgi:two-component system, cell cycle sensor histidine kinase and response regulator CckA
VPADHSKDDHGSSSEELHPLLRAAPQGVQIYRLGADGQLVLVGYNPAADSTLGVAHAELLGQPVERCLPFVAGTDIPARLAALANGGHPLEIDRIDDGPGSSARSFRLYAFPMGPGCAVLNILDVTGRRHLERALQDSRDSAAAFVTHMPAALVLFGWDRGDRLVLREANPAARRLFPDQIEGWLGRSLDEIWPRARGPVGSAMLEVMRTGRALHLDDIPSVATPARHFRVTAFALPGDRLAVTGEDITAQRQAAAERARLEEQLRQAQRLESIGRLAGGVAHDFNNFLTGILGNVSLLRLRRGADDPIYPTLLEIERATQRAASLTRQLLAFSRTQVIEPRAIDLNALLAELRRMLVRLLGEDIRLHFVAAEDLGPVQADPGQIEQIIVNLAVNARDAMPEGGTLTFETRAVVLDEASCREQVGARPGAFVELAVSDTGSGMSEEVKAHVFEPFFTTKEVGKGTGLGLAMVYGAVQQNRGFLELSSEVGRGTTFKIYLPRASEREARPPRADGDERLPTGSETILLVEDEPVVRDVAQRLLRMLGYQVLPCANADEALGRARAHGTIHLLLTDVIMPGRTGPELADALRAERPELRVLYCSGYTDSTIVERGLIGPGVCYLAKPYTPMELAKKTREALGA